MPEEFIQRQNIFACNDCHDIVQLQADRNINVRPLFWQGKGVENIPLVIMGGNPSAVGTPNEPKRDDGRDFGYYFDYYQNRTESEEINKKQARNLGISYPVTYWSKCHNTAKRLITHREVQRWQDYVLMEAIHCFYNKENNLNRIQRATVARTCFNKHTRDMLLFLKPQMIVLLGDTPYNLLRQLGYLGELGICEFSRMTIQGEIDGTIITLHIPVLRQPRPNNWGSPYCDEGVYEAFRKFAGFNG